MTLTPIPNQRFTKLDADGNTLANDATNHVAVLDTLPRADGLWRIWALSNLVESCSNQATVAKAAADLRLLSADDWTLADIDELSSLADRSRYNPTINVEFFPGTESDWYWSSTPHAADASYVWVVGFGYGLVGDCRRGGNLAFGRAVRRVAASQ